MKQRKKMFPFKESCWLHLHLVDYRIKWCGFYQLERCSADHFKPRFRNRCVKQHLEEDTNENNWVEKNVDECRAQFYISPVFVQVASLEKTTTPCSDAFQLRIFDQLQKNKCALYYDAAQKSVIVDLTRIRFNVSYLKKAT